MWSALRAGFENRPLLGFCAAIVAGASAGSLELLDAQAWRALALTTVSIWLAACLVRSTTASTRRGLLCALCATLAGLRAAEASTDRARAEALACPSGVLASTSSGETILFRLEPSGRTWLLPRGIVETGARVVVDPVHEPPAWPAGPIPGPRRRSEGRPSVELGPGELVRVEPSPETLLGRARGALELLRASLVRRTADLAEPDTRSFVRALLFGDTSELAPEIPDLFVRTGTFHVLAVSGMQVVLVLGVLVLPFCAAFAWLVARLTRRREGSLRDWVALPWLVAFVPIAGAGAPIVRSALGAAFALLAPHLACARGVVVEARGARTRLHLGRSADSLSGWAAALIVECVLHPNAPTSLSVQLSYAATFGLVAGTRPALAWVRLCAGLGAAGAPLVARVGRTGRPRSPWTWVLLERAIHALCCAVAASLAAVLATLPFVWVRLSEWSPWGVLATPALGVSSAVLFVGGWIQVVCPALAIEPVLDLAARAMVGSMRCFDLLPCTPSLLPPRPAWLVATACALTFASVRGGGRTWPARVAAVAWAALILPWNPVAERITIHACDVGAGTAIVIDGPGLGTWVFDAGSRDRPDTAHEALGPLIASLEAGEVRLVLSHADRDHDGALAWLLERRPPALFAGAVTSALRERLPRATTVVTLDVGTARLWDGPQITLDLVRARRGEASDNEASYALELCVRGERVILFGDAEEEGLDAWIATRGPLGHARLVLWPHHGSDSDRLDALVRATHPAEVWISASGRPPAARELTRRAVVTRCTGSEGPLRITLPESASDGRMEPP